jgi:hypothetical protein
MANEVAKPSGVFGGQVTMTNSAKLLEALEDSSSKDPRGAAADGSDYMNFSGKRGVYEIGKDKNDADPEELWVVAIGNFEDGWICWKGGRVMAARMANMGNPIPQPNMDEHGPFTKDGDGWYQAKSLVAKSVDSGQQVYFKINSTSGVSEFASLQKAVVQRLRAGLPAWPVIAFSKEKFKAQGYDNFKPILKVEGWLSDEGLSKLGELMEAEEGTIDMDELYALSNAPSGGIEDQSSADTDEGDTAAPAEQPKTARRNKRL